MRLTDRKFNKRQNMKKYFILLVLALTLGITSQAASQKHRHNPAITAPASASSSTASSTSVGSSTPTTQPDEGIEAYSDTTSAVIDSLATMLTSHGAVDRNSRAWPRWGIYVWPNYYVSKNYADEVNYLKQWLHDRVAWMDQALGFAQQKP